ncbi:MAG TPA: hypothetical protein PKV73_15970 [Agriterribacter sp.]|nr:hypothetical protein [Agriterribacter sp.]
MKQLTGILFLTLHLLAFTECRQLLRVPYLLKHFQQHQSKEPGMNLASFIKLHYGSPLTVTDDFKQDQQLPFRSVDCSLQITSVYVYEPVPLSVNFPVTAPAIRFHHFNEPNKPQFAAISVFQPPRSSGII